MLSFRGGGERVRRARVVCSRGPRPLICVLKSEEYVATYTNKGRGERVEVRSLDSEDEKKYYFINRDLCEADALADFRLRQLRKSKDQFQ